MKQPSIVTLRLIEMAVAQLASGASWEAIGRLVKRRPATCKRWRERYAALWKPLYREAETLMFQTSMAEARVVMAELDQEKQRKLRAGLPPVG